MSPTEYDPFLRGFTANKNGIYYPDVNPTIMFIPKKYFYTLSNINVGHQSWYHYMETYQLTEKDMGFMNDYTYNTNSFNINNPYYKMIGRDESTILMDRNQVLNYSLLGTKLPNL